MQKLSFYEIMRSGDIKRWHIVNTARQQTLAEHLWRATAIAIELYHKMYPDSKPGLELLQMVMRSLYDDCAEIRTGDIPTPAKSIIRGMAGNVIKEIERQAMPVIPYIGGEMPENLQRIAKMADAIEAAHFIKENAVGTFAESVARTNNRLMADYIVKFTDETGQDWFKPVNEVLMELGMPYVSNFMRMTPP